MTISEAVKAGVSRLRLPVWASPVCYLRIDLAGETRGPWGHLYDRPTQEAIGAPTPQDLPLFDDGDADDYEPYAGPLDEADKASR